MSSFYVVDRLGEELMIGSNVKFRTWQGRNVFFTGTGQIQNIDPFGNIYIDPDSALHIEGEDGSFDATVVMVSTAPIESNRVGQTGFKGYREHFAKMAVDRKPSMVGISWIELLSNF
jgi:hypothetical protein